MKKFLMVLGVIFGLILLSGISMISYAAYVGPTLDKESRAFVNKVLPEITADWDVDIYYSYSDKEALKKAGVTKDKMKNIFDEYKNIFGKTKQLDECQGQANIQIMIGNKDQITANYVTHATFDTGPGQILLFLSKSTGEWKIMAMRVDKITI